MSWYKISQIETETMQEMFKGQDLSGLCVTCAVKMAFKIDGEYVEGIVMGGQPRRRILHAWAEKNETVYDPTLDIVMPKAKWESVMQPEELYRINGEAAMIKSIKTGSFEFVSQPEG